MRYFVLLLAILLGTALRTLSAQSNTQALSRSHAPVSSKEKASVESAVQFLLTSAAADFHAHGPSGPLRFRRVRIGHVMGPNAVKQYRLCGQFMRIQQGVKSRWSPFVTIKTSGVEQYVGTQAADFCKDSSVIWDNAGDLSSLLQSRFDKLR